jgi:hypothetical protein
MIRSIISLFFSVLICSPLFANEGCTRASLQSAVDSYIAAQQAGNPDQMPLASSVKYIENMANSSIERSVIQIALPIAFHRSFLDTETCKTFTEVIVTKGEHPYVIGIRFNLQNSKINEINAIVTDEGDWEFNAENSFNASSREDWNILPENQRVDRQTLINAANAYFDTFTYEDVKVPWGIPCARLEGGKYSGDGPRTSCKTGVPLEGIEIADRSFVVDTDMGTVNVFSRFGVTQNPRFGKTNGLPDSHTFRLVNGRLRYIHSMSAVD